MKIFSAFIILLISIASIQCNSQSEKSIEVSFPRVDSEPLSTIPENAIILYDDWEMKESAIIGMTGEKISKSEYKMENWYSTSVPTTVLGTLIRNGVYPDPYIGMNNMLIPDMSDDFNERYDLGKYSHLPDSSNPWAKPYWFRKEFEVPADYEGQIVWLNVDGINYRADVWVNGKLVADSENTVGMFRRFRLNITENALPGKKNTLAIAIYPLDFTGDPLYAQVEGLNGNVGPNGGDADILRNVTQYSTIGWDWVPAVRDRNMGLWQHVSINSSGPVVVADPAAFTAVNISDDTTAEVKLRFFLTNASKEDQNANLNISIKPDGLPSEELIINTSVKIKAESRKEVILNPDEYPDLNLNNPNLWWPVTHGDQPLYNLVVGVHINGQLSSDHKSKFGVRELDSFILPSGGRAFSVNGKTIRIAGGAWISDFLLSWSAQRYRDEIRLMAEGNATLVRVNGCSIMPPDVFFDACDKHGLLVWEDFSRTSVAPNFRKDGIKSRRPPACDSTIYMNNMVDVISRIRGRASLLLYCGSNEDAPQEDTGTALQNEVLPEMDGTRIFLPSSSEQPDWSTIEVATTTGGPWQMIKLPWYYWLYENQKGFESRNEIGLASVQTINAVATANPDFNTPDSIDFPLNRSMGYHDATGDWTMGSYIKIMQEDIGKPSSIAEFLKWGDLYNNQVYRSIFEAANKARPRNEGTILWKSNAAWLSFNWQIFDWSLRANAGYYTMKSALKPLHVQYSHPDAGIQVVSTLGDNLTNLTVKTSVYSSDGKMQEEKSSQVNVEANQTIYVDSIRSLISDTSKLYFITLDLKDQSGNQMDRTVTWTHKNTKWKELLSIPPADVNCRILNQKVVENEIEYSIEVINTSDVPAINTMLEITEGSFGEEILPAFWDDNALTMVPGETKTVTVRVRKDLIKGQPHILFEGLNVNPSSWNIDSGIKESLNFTIDDLQISSLSEKTYLNFSANQIDNIGTRITTIPVKLSIDGKLIRYVSVAIKKGMSIDGRIELTNWSSSEHSIEFGGRTKILN